MARAKKEAALTPEERLQAALVPDWEWPYKLPKNWCWTRIGMVSNFERGITFPAAAKEAAPTEDNIPCLRTANVQENLEIDDMKTFLIMMLSLQTNAAPLITVQ